ncbi:Cysteine-rich protein 2-binding protein, variant 2 [Entomophthora muscae]|uniref:Cysteine-rich protein 2-binding protein, variant 2 n=1 Tax=Entomophthora muscae TaxID=34485 RepID=A0ACC2SY81_9FUNG|nr:Cysteine-rich protein 2-binding protein, variant 2 [Entomophthora muscae]
MESLPYNLHELTWDDEHLTNTQGQYCYCGMNKTKLLNNDMFQCKVCKQWFHFGCIKSASTNFLYGDVWADFTCSLCSPTSTEIFIQTLTSWRISIFRIVKHLTILRFDEMGTFKNAFFPAYMITKTMDENWDIVRHGQIRTATWTNTVAAEMCTNSVLFQSGTDTLGVKGHWGLREVFSKSEITTEEVFKLQPASNRHRTNLTKEKEPREMRQGSEVSSPRESLGRIARGSDVGEKHIKRKRGPKINPPLAESLEKKKKRVCQPKKVGSPLKSPTSSKVTIEAQDLSKEKGSPNVFFGQSLPDPSTEKHKSIWNLSPKDHRVSRGLGRNARRCFHLMKAYSISTKVHPVRLITPLERLVSPNSCLASKAQSPALSTDSSSLTYILSSDHEIDDLMKPPEPSVASNLASHLSTKGPDVPKEFKNFHKVSSEREVYPISPPQLEHKLMSSIQEWQLLQRLDHSRALTPAARRLKRKLAMNRHKDSLGIPRFNLNHSVNKYLQHRALRIQPCFPPFEATREPSREHTRESSAEPIVEHMQEHTKDSNHESMNKLIKDDNLKERETRHSLVSEVCVTPWEKSFASRLYGPILSNRRAALRSLSRISPYHGTELLPVIWQVKALPKHQWPVKLRLLMALKQKHTLRSIKGSPARPIKKFSVPTRHSPISIADREIKALPQPLDFCYIEPRHLPQVNQLLSRLFWTGINMREALQYPDYGIVVLYGSLVIGCAFMTPGHYITYLAIAPGWQNSGLGKKLLFLLIQKSRGHDITLHVSTNNPALILYQAFGFKIEQFLVNFYDKYISPNSCMHRNAFFVRLRQD